jgi:hypothetical protein
MAHRDREHAKEYVRILLNDLLKLTYGEPGAFGHFSNRLAGTYRRDLGYLLDEHDDLRAVLIASIEPLYQRSKQDAHRELSAERFQHKPFPPECPWSLEQVLKAPLEGTNSPFFGEPS